VAQRRALQLVFQHPYGSFNPRRTTGDAIARAALLAEATRGDDGDVEAMLAHVALGADAGGRYPDQLSGGELQRAAIARALAARPTVLLCDEITVSLDPVVQAAIIELLDRLRRTLGLTIVFVAHDHALVAAAADRTLLLADGRLGAVPARP
jgi:peptide/nickel transport system ATP-binding protein